MAIRPKSKEKGLEMDFLKLVPGYRTALMDGTMVPDSPGHMATWRLYHAYQGDKIHLCAPGYMFAVAEFSLERDPVYIYAYAYQKEENWTTYTKNLTPDSYQVEDYIFEKECYFRTCIKRADGADLTAQDDILKEEILCFDSKVPAYAEPAYFTEEIEDTIGKIQRFTKEKVESQTAKFCLLTDTHYTVNGTWEDTAHNILRVAAGADYDAVVHLGDLTDGMLPKELTAYYAEQIIKDLQKTGKPVYITQGNHDSNYFRNKENTFTAEEIWKLYGADCFGNDKEQKGGLVKERFDYYVDIPEKCIRMIFISSFEDTAPVRYGYKKQQITWLDEVMQGAEKGTKFLVFSHDAPLGKLDYWSFYIDHGEEFLQVLEKYNAKEEYQVIGLFYGHTHADYIFEECSFPVVSVGCAKLEFFTDKKPDGAVTWERKADDVTQELWDSLLIDFEKQVLKLIRFGAGKDREVSFAKKNISYCERAKAKKQSRSMKIWAHRGASGHAPENTMPAFELAEKMGADGIELDVQLTKDGVPVIIHDERIDRVCDGTGFVKDYTLEELKSFNAGKAYPAYGKVEIPTLEEFYAWVAETDLTINLELKNSVIFYEGLEEKVLELAEKYGLEERLIYSSFNHYSMRRLKMLKPDARIAFLYSCGILDVGEYADKYHGYAMHPSLKAMEYPDVDIVKQCHDKGIKVHVWTVNQKPDMDKMKELGADAIITNYIELATD